MENRTFIPLISSNYLNVNRSVIFLPHLIKFGGIAATPWHLRRRNDWRRPDRP